MERGSPSCFERSEAVNGGAPLSLFLTLVILTMPGIVAVVLPIILFVAVAFVYNKLTVESELIVLRALGLSQWRLAQPALDLKCDKFHKCFTSYA